MSQSAPSVEVVPEWSLLLAASSPDVQDLDFNHIRRLLPQSLDWIATLRLADQHGLISLLYQNLAPLHDVVPPAVLASLRQSYERNIHKSLFLTRELIRVLDCLGGLGIDVVPYKGVVLSKVYYGDMALRQSGDLDLFVRRQDVTRIESAVRALGYTPRVLIPEDAERNYIDSGYECTFDSAAGINLLEFQWALQPRFYAVDFDMNGLFERAVTVSVADRYMKTPSPEDLLLILSAHAAKHVWGRLIWLCDIAQIIKRQNLNWDWIHSQSQELGIQRILHITLRLMHRFLATPMPARIKDAVLADRAALDFTERIAASVAAGVTYEEEKLSYFRLMMRLRERPLDRLRFLARLTLTPGPGEWEVVRLPKSLFGFYRLVRLGRLAARWIRS
ncbi:MAG TPA: nucleotidyltransferase family protein [Candidatus Acidoferrales bacterium]|nr:nucleotidyltransferase family protein [Candidatus Acidoferrales bacterium]